MGSNLMVKNHSVKAFYLLVILLSVPLWLVGGIKLSLPVKLPVSALTAFIPVIAASILCFRRDGRQGLKELFQRAWDYRKIEEKRWYLPVLLLAPSIYLVSFFIMQLTGRPLPDKIVLSFLWVPVAFVIFLPSGAGEELGWSGYATEPMADRWGALRAGFLLGVLWAVWHSVAFLQTGWSLEWVVWQSIKTIAMRMIIVWIYYKTGRSVFAATLYHTTDNVSWSLFPNFGDSYDPLVTGLVNCIVTVVIILTGGFNNAARSHGQE
jgi:uncharacterized protein